MGDKSEKIETYDEIKQVGILSGKPCEERPVGPRRRAPVFYAGETYGRRRMHYPDVERHGNGVVPGVRDKFMRRLIRKAFKVHHSKVEKALKLPRAMFEQARQIAKEEKKSSHWARRLFEKELALHQAAPNKPTRAQRRALKRAGVKDAISQLVGAMARK